MNTYIKVIFAVIFGLLLLDASHGQGLQRTKRVDPSGTQDSTTIQGAINSITDTTVRWTVLVYAGTYAENIDLDANTKKNIDIVGVDRDAVIIAPTSGDGIKCDQHSGGGKNSIRNLTVKTTSGHGILLGPDCTVSNVTVDVSGTDKNGIIGTNYSPTTIEDSSVKTANGHGILVGDDCTIVNVLVDVAGTGKDGVGDGTKVRTAITGSFIKSAAGNGVALGSNSVLLNSRIEAIGSGDRNGIVLGSSDSIRIENCTVKANYRALSASVGNDPSDDLTVLGSQFETYGVGGPYTATVTLGGARRALIKDCVIINDGTNNSSFDPVGVFLDTNGSAPTPSVQMQSCRVRVIGTGSTQPQGVRNDINITTPGLTLIECEIEVSAVNTTGGTGAWGVANAVKVVGGRITTSVVNEKATEVYDLYKPGNGTAPGVVNTAFSKWLGPIQPSLGKRQYIQRTLNASAGSSNAILVETALSVSEQTLTSGFQDPDAYRVLTATPTTPFGQARTVYIVGKDWAGNTIAEAFTVSTTAVTGNKAFAEVDKIILPAGTTSEKLTIGTANKFGLQVPIAVTGDVIQQARKATAASSYTVESVGTVDAIYATVSVNVTSGDSFEWVILTGK